MRAKVSWRIMRAPWGYTGEIEIPLALVHGAARAAGSTSPRAPSVVVRAHTRVPAGASTRKRKRKKKSLFSRLLRAAAPLSAAIPGVGPAAQLALSQAARMAGGEELSGEYIAPSARALAARCR